MYASTALKSLGFCQFPVFHHSMRKCFLVSALSLFSISANAAVADYDFENDGIRYSIISTTEFTAEVVGFSTEITDGIIHIPATVEFRGRTISILGLAENAFESIQTDTISFNLGELTYVKNQPDNKVLKVYADSHEQFTGGKCYPIASENHKFYYVDNKPFDSLYDIATSKVEFQYVYTLKHIDLSRLNQTALPSFRGCVNIEYSKLPDNAEIPQSGFRDCYKLKRIEVADNKLYKAEDYAFYNCTALEIIDGWFNSSTLMQHTFDYCPKLESLSLSKNFSMFRGYYTYSWNSEKYEYPFNGTPNIREVNIQSLERWMAIDTRFDSRSSGYAPYFIKKGRTTQGLDNFALKLNGKPVEIITVDGSEYRVKPNTFYGVNTLKKATIGPNVKYIDHHAFFNCKNLTYMELNNSIKTIEEEAFAGSPIVHIDVPSSVEKISSRAFADTRSVDFWCVLSEWSENGIADKTEEIGFHNTVHTGTYNCPTLKRVRVDTSEDMVQIDKEAFSNCPNIEELIIENISSIYTFEENCFAGTSIKSLRFPDWPTICGGAFKNCIQLTNVVFEHSSNIMGHSSTGYTWNGMKYSGECPFYGCMNLSSLSFANNLNITRWYHKTGTTSANITWYNLSSDRLTPWYDCPISEINVTGREFDIDLHMNVEHPLKRLNLSKQTEKIHITGKSCDEQSTNGKKIFFEYSYDYQIDPTLEIECHNPKPTVIDGSFPTNVYLNATVRVPARSIEAYKKSESWKPFWNIESLPTDGIESIEIDESQTLTDIYSLQGICLKHNATASDIDALAPGLYIIAGKKVIVK